MAQVQSIDWAARRVYLHADTVASGFDCIAAHFEIKAIIAANQNNEQGYQAVMTAEGNLLKTAGKYTPRYGYVSPGWRFVPADVDHKLNLLVEIISQDGVVDKDVFDRSGVASNVDIDAVYESIEIREVATAGGLTQADIDSISAAVAQAVLFNTQFDSNGDPL